MIYAIHSINYFVRQQILGIGIFERLIYALIYAEITYIPKTLPIKMLTRSINSIYT